MFKEIWLGIDCRDKIKYSNVNFLCISLDLLEETQNICLFVFSVVVFFYRFLFCFFFLFSSSSLFSLFGLQERTSSRRDVIIYLYPGDFRDI